MNNNHFYVYRASKTVLKVILKALNITGIIILRALRFQIIWTLESKILGLAKFGIWNITSSAIHSHLPTTSTPNKRRLYTQTIPLSTFPRPPPSLSVFHHQPLAPRLAAFLPQYTTSYSTQTAHEMRSPLTRLLFLVSVAGHVVISVHFPAPQKISLAPSTYATVSVISDLHVDTAPNRAWVQSNLFPPPEPGFHVLALGGDVSSSLSTIRSTLRELRMRFSAVVFIAGNHELWNPNPGSTSFNKLQDIKDVCDEEEVCSGPLTLFVGSESVDVVPLQAWYTAEFDTSPEINSAEWRELETLKPFETRWGDYRKCRWAAGVDPESVAKEMDDINHRHHHRFKPPLTGRLESHSLITISHFLPSLRCLPEKGMLREPRIHSVVGR